VLTALQKFDEAAKAADQAITLDWRGPGNFFVRGLMHARMNRFDLAVSDYSEALRLKPDFELAYFARSFAFSKLGKAKEAAADRARIEAVKAEAARARQAICAGGASAKVEADDDTPAAAAEAGAAAPGPGVLAITALVAGKTWQAKQGLWLADLEFRADGSFRQVSRTRPKAASSKTGCKSGWTGPGRSRAESSASTPRTCCARRSTSPARP
jgi:tetratricopeptide (TPR) repeat protein